VGKGQPPDELLVERHPDADEVVVALDDAGHEDLAIDFQVRILRLVANGGLEIVELVERIPHRDVVADLGRRVGGVEHAVGGVDRAERLEEHLVLEQILPLFQGVKRRGQRRDDLLE